MKKVSRLFVLLFVPAFLISMSMRAHADVAVEVKLWRVYDFSYFLSVNLTASDPTPIT